MLVNGLRSGCHIDRLGVSLSSELLASTFSSEEPHVGDSTAQGRSLLLPLSSHAAHQGNTSDILQYSNSWVQVDLESSTREIMFTFYPNMDTIREPQVRWSMVNTAILGLLVAYSPVPHFSSTVACASLTHKTPFFVLHTEQVRDE